MIELVRITLLAITLLPAAQASQLDENGEPLTPSKQFERIRSWEGRWRVAETPALKIVFEATARGCAIVERSETAAGLHSMTVYRMDGDAVIATHYCPQGNQSCLESRSTSSGETRTASRSVTVRALSGPLNRAIESGRSASLAPQP